MLWKNLYKIAVTGSRKFANPDLVTQYLDKYIRENFDNTEDVVIVTGNAIGVDATVESYCMRRGIKNLIVHARWLELERAAGPRRNKHIVSMSNELIAFWDGSSKGTADCIRRGKKREKRSKKFTVTVFTIGKLRKKLKIAPPVVVKLPSSTSNRVARKVRDLVKSADLKNFFDDMDVKER